MFSFYKEIFYPKIWFKELLLIGSLLDLGGPVGRNKLGKDQTEHDDGVHKENDSAMWLVNTVSDNINNAGFRLVNWS